MEPELAPEEENDSIGTAPKEVITDVLNFQFSNALVAIQEVMEEVAKRIFGAATLSGHGRIRIELYDAVLLAILEQIKTALLGKMNNKHAQDTWKPAKLSKDLENGCSTTTISSNQ